MFTMIIFYDSLHLNRLYEGTFVLMVVNVEGALFGVICALTTKDKRAIVVRNHYNKQGSLLFIFQ